MGRRIGRVDDAPIIDASDAASLADGRRAVAFPTTLVVADDHPIVRAGLRALLATTADMQLVGESGDGLEVLTLVEQLAPAVLVLDLMLPGLSGLEVTRRVSRKTRVLILSMHAEEGYVLETLRNGACGYLLKGCPAEEILRAVRTVAGGQRHLGSPFAQRAADAYASAALGSSAPALSDPVDLYVNLTNREREVFQLAAEGLTNPKIGKRLFISPRTVEVHRGQVMKKLQLQTATELVRFALRRGLMRVER